MCLYLIRTASNLNSYLFFAKLLNYLTDYPDKRFETFSEDCPELLFIPDEFSHLWVIAVIELDKASARWVCN